MKDEEENGIRKPPLLMQHGIECDHMFWFVGEPEIAPPFILARSGYDVWLGNNRGNRFCKSHERLDPKSK